MLLRSIRAAEFELLTQCSTPFRGLDNKKQLRQLKQNWSGDYPARDILIAESSKGQIAALVFTEPSVFTQVGLRLWLFPKAALAGAELEQLAQAVCAYYPQLLSFEVLLHPQSFLAAADSKLALKLKPDFWQSVPTDVAPALSCHFYRAEVLCPRDFVLRIDNFWFYLKLATEVDSVIALRFLTEHSQLKAGPEMNLLNHYGLLAEAKRFSPQAANRHFAKANVNHSSAFVRRVRQELSEYLAGERYSFDFAYTIVKGSCFQQTVWRNLQKVPYGSTITYEQLAQMSVAPAQNSKNYARAVGAAMRSNPLVLIIPCHRVIGSKGNLTGFAAGVGLKEQLLNLELLKIVLDKGENAPYNG